MSRFLNEKFHSLVAYTPGEQPQDMVYIKLNTNESPYPPSPKVMEAVSDEEVRKLRLYPDPDCTQLCEKLAALYDVKKENIFLSNGSDDILNFAFMAFTGQGAGLAARFPEISYGFYSVFGDLHQVAYEKIPLQEDFSINVDDYCHGRGMIVIANPNAPTGLTLSISQIRQILEANQDNLVVIDEAYVDFGAESCVPLIHQYDNLLVVQTFSKSRSMAGARLGFAIADSAIIADLNKIKYSTNPYNINRLTMAAACAALEENDYYMKNCKAIEATRQTTATALRAMGFRVLPSAANFLFIESPAISGEELYQRLKSKGVLIRHFTTDKIKNFNRVTIGTPDEMKIFLARVEEILSETKQNNQKTI